MQAITIHAQNKKQAKIFEQLAKALNLSFSIQEANNIEYEAMLQKSFKEAKEGKTHKIAIKNLWK